MLLVGGALGTGRIWTTVAAESIRAMAQQSTVVVIAHKLSTVLSADGTVEDSGTHADLMVAGGQYADFWAQRGSANGLDDGDGANSDEGRHVRIG